ncbi:MAG TPA: S1 family peptidase [Polyangiaceae bacterium LLY-WYZ-15_(1-7)]|nr:hypothetical protein [Myxococcales bacterium]HJK90761.1 S1 family peptidase [Polyangiaceae bacterium LLY-WYZ-15_(1-7)]HJL35757.1 S1 family peptidase [Polyangiaceae bacterium LLY-WYZ-15_(1-7)]
MRRVLACLLLVACAAETPETIGSTEAPIINGTRETGFPEVVAVVRVNSRGSIVGLCTGTVIGPRTVLTAKHCIYSDTTRIPDSSMRVLVTNNVYGTITGTYRVSDSLTTPGPFTDDDLTEGQDIAVLTTSSRISGVTPREVARSTARNGMPIEIVGFGRTDPRSGASGVKYSGTTNVGDIFRNVFQTVGMSRTCQGDSGGPAFDATGRVLGVTSFGVDERCREDMSYYTEVAPHLAMIETALGAEPSCTVYSASCNGADDDCDGMVDTGCGVLGSPCFDPSECTTGECRRVDGEFVCVQTCNPEQELTGCPDGFVCDPLTCGAGQCVAGAPGAGADGSACSDDSDCQSNHCWRRDDGSAICGRACSPGGAECPEGLVCATEGFACGACIVPDPTAPQPFGAACTEAGQCESGDCSADGFCTQACASHAECPGYRCDTDGRCALGTPTPPGGTCAVDGECEDGAGCVDIEGERVCATSCDAGCAAGTICTDGFCLPDGLPLGDLCTTNEECASGICAGTCTRICEDTASCPADFECRPAGSVSGCFPVGVEPMEPMEGDGGGCAAGGTAPFGAGFALFALVLLRRRR